MVFGARKVDSTNIKEEIFNVKSIRHYLPPLVLLLVCLPFAQAQSSVDINMGFGFAHASSLGSVDNYYADANFTDLCNSGGVTSTSCQNTPTLSNFFLGFGGNLMLWKHFGIGIDASVQPSKQTYLTIQPAALDYGTLATRVTFYNFDAIYQPYSTKRVELQVKGGIGGTNVKFYNNVSSSSTVLGNQSSSEYFGSANHFQVEGGLGVQLFVTDHFFIRPEVDVHWVHNFSQFGSGAVPEAMVWVGYSIGDRQ